MKKLYRSDDNVILTGLLGGIGEYLEIDPVIVRLIFVVFLVGTAFVPGIIIYIIALFLVPKRSERVTVIDVE